MIRIADLGFAYSAEPVLENVNLDFEDGKVYGLLGENGVGKTTLLTLIAGVKKPQEGSLTVNGHKPIDRNPDFLEDIYYLPDEVAPVQMEALEWAGLEAMFRPKYDARAFERIMGDFEVPSDKRMDSMSAGQLKKTYISFALACGASIVLMDEPTNALDIPGKSCFRECIRSYASADSGRTVIISTHQAKDVESIVNPIIILDKDGVLLNSSLEEITANIYFDYGTSLNPNSLYSEQIPGGFVQVYPNSGEGESAVNLEALFNAVHRNKEYFKAIFSK